MHTHTKWNDELLHAQTTSDVTRVLRDYLNAIAPDVWDSLPSACQAALTVDDIPGSALALKREELHFRGNPSTHAALNDIAQTFIAASNRILSIQARG